MWQTNSKVLSTNQGPSNGFAKSCQKVNMNKMDRNHMVAFLQKLNNNRCFNLDAGKMPSVAPSANAKFLPPLISDDRDHRNHFQDSSSNRSTSSVFNINNNNINNNGKGNNSRQQQVPSLGIMNRLAQGMPPLNQENRTMPGKMNLPSKVRDGAPSVPLKQQQQHQPDQERVWMERFQNQNVMLWERVRHLEQTINKLEKNSAQLVDLNSKLEVELHEQIEKNKTLVHKNTSIVLDTSAKDQQINSLREQKMLLMKQNSKLQSYLRTTDEFIGSIQSQHELIEIEHHHRQQQQHQQRQKLMRIEGLSRCASSNSSNGSSSSIASGNGNSKKRKRATTKGRGSGSRRNSIADTTGANGIGIRGGECVR